MPHAARRTLKALPRFADKSQVRAVTQVRVLLSPLVARLNQRFFFGRKRALEAAVRSRTGELDRERIRERSFNQVLVTMVSNRSLGEVLDGVAWLIRDQVPGAEVAVLVTGKAGWQVASAPGLRPRWLSCLHLPDVVPPEIWKLARTAMEPATNPAWKEFSDKVYGELPAAIHTCRIGSEDSACGLILLFDCEGHPATGVASTLESASRLAQLAIEHSRHHEELYFRAHHDTLTGLPNRTELLQRLKTELADARVHNRPLAVLFIDLDNFKHTNHQFSHRMGDLLLCEVAVRMRRTLRGGDTVARIGGDQFNAILSDVAGSSEAAEVAARLLAVIAQPFQADGHELSASASIGIALFPQDGTTADQLLSRADVALHSARDAGRNRAHAFSSTLETTGKAQMESEIRAALRQGRFLLHYQPKITAQGRLAGLEALIRLSHPERGIIPPADFIPIAEQSDLIVQIGTWVLDEVCRQIVWWRQNGYGQISVAVNASPVQLERPDFAEFVEDCLARHGVPAWSIEIELTENLLIANGGETIRQMRSLRALGVRFSIDDFGAGYSALGYLHQLPVDAIKLDRSFVQSLETSDAARRIVAGLITVARGLGLNVVAEGVETEGQRLALLSAGCPQMQGYYFARPCLAEDLGEILTRCDMPAALCALAGATGESLRPLHDLALV